MERCKHEIYIKFNILQNFNFPRVEIELVFQLFIYEVLSTQILQKSKHYVLCPLFSFFHVPHVPLQTLHSSQGFTESGLQTSGICWQCIGVVLEERMKFFTLTCLCHITQSQQFGAKLVQILTTLGRGLVSCNCREQSTDRLSSALLEVLVFLVDTG